MIQQGNQLKRVLEFQGDDQSYYDDDVDDDDGLLQIHTIIIIIAGVLLYALSFGSECTMLVSNMRQGKEGGQSSGAETRAEQWGRSRAGKAVGGRRMS